MGRRAGYGGTTSFVTWAACPESQAQAGPLSSPSHQRPGRLPPVDAPGDLLGVSTGASCLGPKEGAREGQGEADLPPPWGTAAAPTHCASRAGPGRAAGLGLSPCCASWANRLQSLVCRTMRAGRGGLGRAVCGAVQVELSWMPHVLDASLLDSPLPPVWLTGIRGWEEGRQPPGVWT